MHKSVLLIFAIFLLPHSIKGREIDSISVIKDSYFNNPAFSFYRHESAISYFNITSIFQRDEAYIMQDGNGLSNVQFKASSWMPINDNSRIWGSASYTNGTRKDVKWSETSDSEMLYPYIMADSVGGDMKGQRYTFNGGYAAKIKNIIIGGEIEYRAEIEFRDVDPRPRNIISDLMVKAGASYNIKRYQIGSTIAYSSYNQKNDVDFYSQLGNAYIHTMTGLGNTYNRFDGTRTSAEYTGGNINISTQLRPKNGYGLWMDVSYRIDKKIRRLTSENNIPITKMNVDGLRISATYIDKLGYNSEVGIEADINMISRKGTENLFNSGNGTSMEIIGSRNPYQESDNYYNIGLFYKNRITGGYSIAIKPSASSSSMEMTHTDNDRQMEFTRLSLGSSLENKMAFKSWSLNITAYGYHQPVVKKRLTLSSVANTGMEEMLLWNYAFLSTDKNQFGIKAKVYIPTTQHSTIFFNAGWSGELYSPADRNTISISSLSDKIYKKRRNNSIELNVGILF